MPKLVMPVPRPLTGSWWFTYTFTQRRSRSIYIASRSHCHARLVGQQDREIMRGDLDKGLGRGPELDKGLGRGPEATTGLERRDEQKPH